MYLVMYESHCLFNQYYLAKSTYKFLLRFCQARGACIPLLVSFLLFSSLQFHNNQSFSSSPGLVRKVSKVGQFQFSLQSFRAEGRSENPEGSSSDVVGATQQRFIALRWLHFLMAPPDSPKSSKSVKTLSKSLTNHLLYSSFDLQMNQILKKSSLGNFWVLNPFFSYEDQLSELPSEQAMN